MLSPCKLFGNVATFFWSKKASDVYFLLKYVKPSVWVRREQGWCSGESARLPPMWPVFDSLTRRLMWVEFVVGSLLAPRGFFPGTLVLPSPQKPTLPIPIRSGTHVHV